MQIFLPGARKEEFSLPFLVFRLIFCLLAVRSEDRCPLPMEEMFCSKFFVLFLLQYIYRRQVLKNKYYVKKFFYAKISKVFLALLLFMRKKETL